jgi:hypothetical protein
MPIPYSPAPVPVEYPALRSWAAIQFRRVADALAAPLVTRMRFVILHAEPERFENGDVVLADGADWNPGSGGGLYLRLSGAWVKL